LIGINRQTQYKSILIKNAHIITVDKKDRIIKDGAIFVKNDRIVDIGKSDDLLPKYKAEKIIDARQNLVIPGLINTHSHMVYYLTRGLGMDKHTIDWLRATIWPFMSELSEDDAHIGALLGYVENLKTGTTFVIDNNTCQRKDRKGIIDRVAQASLESGIKTILLRGYHDEPSKIPEIFVESLDEINHEYERIIEKWHNKGDGRIKTWIHPANLLYCSLESLCKFNELAKKHDIGIHTHVAEDREGTNRIKERYGKGYVEVFHDIGVLGPKFQMAHTIFVSEKEIQYIAQAQARVMYTPTTDMLLAAGAPPIHKMRDAGVVVGLGTDSPNNSQDMIQCMKFGALLLKATTENSTIMPAYEILQIATINGAKSMGLENEIGSLEVGKKADIVIVGVHKLHTTPLHDPISTLVYSSSGTDVDTVIVDGEVLVEGGKLVHINESEIMEKAQEAADGVIKRCKSQLNRK
jgi:5-methylthioadenosine/S-adenosylhomocysteine deaminase